MKWVLAESDLKAAAKLSDEGGFHPLIAGLLVNRGIADSSAAQLFLSAELSAVSEAGLFAQMERAVGRVKTAISRGERIVVYGDYDVDGVTGTALLSLALKDLGAAVDCYIPDRMTEGYGLNIQAIQKIKTSSAGLLITVDCGISALKEAEYARTIGLDLIITDHHEFSNPKSESPNTLQKFETRNSKLEYILPDAYAVLHPALVFPEAPVHARESVSVLTGVGAAFKLAQALMGAGPADERLMQYLDLVTLGTVADMGRITGENRILVKHGLGLLSSDAAIQRPGIAALKQVAGLNGKKITVGMVGFSLAPRINASGRMERADAAFRLLTTGSPEEAAALALALDGANRERQSVEERIWDEARLLCQRTDTDPVGAFVLSSPEWHPGVIGIVASRIADRFYRPAALISVRDGVGKGSARSIPGFDLYRGLTECSDLLMGFGGHKCAAGFTIAEERIPELRERLGSLALNMLGPDGFVRTLSVDGAVKLADLTHGLMRELERLGPFGPGNPEPRLGARGLTVVSSRIVGNNHLKLKLRQENGVLFDAIAFNRGSLLGTKVKDGGRLAAVFTPRINTWNGNTAIELEIKDVKVEN